MKSTIIISLGGSVIVPSEIDTRFLKEFRELIKSYLGKYKFVIITGGGKTCRDYQNAAKSITELSPEALDWLGIETTKLNAHLVRTILNDIAHKDVLANPTKKIDFDNMLIASGWKPGSSTDYDAVLFAKTFGSKIVINITNVDYLYDKDPTKFKDAQKIEKIDWNGFKKIVGDKWIPGMNVPFDPVATKKAAELKLKLVLLGKDLNNLGNFLDGKKFKGSIVE